MGASQRRERKITAERARELLRYESDTGRLIWRVDRRGGVKAGSVAGCVTRKEERRRYIIVGIDGVLFFAHRLAFLIKKGVWPSGDVDHRDGDGLNNKWGNLRDVTRTINMQNAVARSDNSSGVPGVCWHKAARKWHVRITVYGECKNIGLFEYFDDAVRARKSAESAYGFLPRHGSKAA